MFNFGKHGNDTVYGALIDISSGSVGVAIVVSLKDEKIPNILFSHRTTMRVTEYGAEKVEHIRRVRESLFTAALVLSQEGMNTLYEFDRNAVITKLYVTCSSPWSYTIARTVNLKNDEPIRVTHSIINDVVQSAETEILNYVHTIPNLGEGEFSVVERATVDITVNQYPIANPINQKGTELGLTHISGLIPQEILEAVDEVQKKLFPKTVLHTHTFMLVMYCVLRDTFPRLNSLCIIDITGEATECAVVENGLLIENVSIPIGRNTFIRNVMSATNKPTADIESHMSVTGDNSHLSDPFLNEEIQNYEQHLVSLFNKILEHRTLPPDIVITAQNAYEPFFQPIIERAYKKVMRSDGKIISVRQSIVEGSENNSIDDMYLIVSARFFHKLHGCGEVDYT